MAVGARRAPRHRADRGPRAARRGRPDARPRRPRSRRPRPRSPLPRSSRRRAPPRQQAPVEEPPAIDLAAEANLAAEADVEEAEELELEDEPVAASQATDADVWNVLENGIREISGEVRNSLDFHRSQDGGGEVSHVVLSGAAEEIPGFAEALAARARRARSARQAVGFVDERLGESTSPRTASRSPRASPTAEAPQ